METVSIRGEESTDTSSFPWQNQRTSCHGLVSMESTLVEQLEKKFDTFNTRGLESCGHISGPVKGLPYCASRLVPSVQWFMATTGYGGRCPRDGKVKRVVLGWTRCGWIVCGNIGSHISIWCMKRAKGDIVGGIDSGCFGWERVGCLTHKGRS